MLYTYIASSGGFTRVLAMRLLTGGLTLALVGVLILLFPLVLAVFVAAVCFLGGAAMLAGAWKVYRAVPSSTARSPEGGKYEEAVWREVR